MSVLHTATTPPPRWTPAPATPQPGEEAMITRVPGVSSGLPAAAIALLRWDDGTRWALYARTVFGRDPIAAAGAEVCVLRDETVSVSRTHLEIGFDDHGTWAADQGSTNGTVLVRGDLRLPLVPRQRVSLRRGDLLELGDRRVSVEAAR